MSALTGWLEHIGVLAVFGFVLVEQVGLPLPTYPVLIVAGAWSARGGPAAVEIVAAAIAACLLADLAWYASGRRFGSRVLRAMCRLSLEPDSCVSDTEHLFARFGTRALMMAKFIPGLGAVTTAMSGVVCARLSGFLVYDFIGATLWAGSAVALGWMFHDAVDDVFSELAALGRVGGLFILGLLLFMGVMIGGQTLMTSTIEEKSSRVVEILLSAISPIELMAGKLIGQLAVGLSVMLVYIGLGLYALSSFSMLSSFDPMLAVYLIVFFLITYLVYGAIMLSIGAAVNQLADAQSLMGPVMILLIAPYVLAPVIGRAPNSTFSVAVSFIPPVNTFGMIARLASDSPPPAWQVWLTALVGVGAACVTVWFAAKVFKIGLLMHGKPPSFATLIRWAREA